MITNAVERKWITETARSVAWPANFGVIRYRRRSLGEHRVTLISETSRTGVLDDDFGGESDGPRHVGDHRRRGAQVDH